MPFETGAEAPKKKIAVIGAGISGMGAAYMLAQDHRVVLIESEPRLGGHARTLISGKNGDQPVDTGFIVFNYANYPHLAALFDELDVPVTKSEMSFGTSIDGGRVEYGLASLDAVFAQRRNLANPRFLRMTRDIMYFNANALRVANDNPDLTIGQFLEKLGTGDWFRDYYLLPFSGAIWSTPPDKILEFPAHPLVQFFENHALLNYSGQHQWYTIQGGSIQYVSRLGHAMRYRGVDVRLNAPVAAVKRSAMGVELRCHGGEWELFDEVVFATHSDVSLRLIADPTAQERALLGAIRYQPNDVVLHADRALMPNRPKVWSSWNYTEEAGKTNDRIDLTYWMNSLQPIPKDDPLFVTLNNTQRIREELIYDQSTFDHPVFDLEAMAAQKVLAARNGSNRTWFCGAWMKNGFHEDGLSSAVDVVEAIRVAEAPVAVAAE
jgi:hypothetical protein